MIETKTEMYLRGKLQAVLFCDINGLPQLDFVEVAPYDWKFRECAYYRDDTVTICVPKCAHIGHGGAAWSYPGYRIDRTPYGVVAHELGHHADRTRSERKHKYSGDYSLHMRAALPDVEAITSYAPNHAEWFAELFRLFVTNPDYLQRIRPSAWSWLRRDFTPVVSDPWDKVLENSPVRTARQAATEVLRA